MRAQRRSGVTVTLIRATTTTGTDDLGDSPADPAAPERLRIEGAVFEPERILEQAGNDQVPVIRPAVWNLPGVYDVDADDVIDSPDGISWYVVGGGNVWLDRTKVPVQLTRSV